MSQMTMDSFAASVRRFSPRLLLSELLLKQWFEPVIPFAVMIGLWLYFALVIPDYATVQNTLSLLRLFAEFGFVALAMAFCLITGGIDLSVGAIFAVCNFSALFFLFVLEQPVGVAVLLTLAVGAALGSINGFLIGFLKTRPFLTTLVTLIILRASVNLLNTRYAQVFATNSVDSDAWDYLGVGSVFGIPVNAATLFVVLLVCHIFLSPFALRLASHGDRRQPQGRPACRHSRSADAVLDLRAFRRALRRKRDFLRGASIEHGFDHRRRLGIPGAHGGRARRRVAGRRQGDGLAGDDRRADHLSAHQRSRADGNSGLRHLGGDRNDLARRGRHRREMVEESRQSHSEDLRQPGVCRVGVGAIRPAR